MTIKKREEIIPLIKLLNTDPEVILELKDIIDEQGKTPLIIALDEHLYKEFIIMINPIDLGEPAIYFDPFNIAVSSGKKPLIWPKREEYVSKDLSGMANTKTEYNSVYSAYNYILTMKRPKIKKTLLEACLSYTYDNTKDIKISNTPKRELISHAVIYTEEDIIKYGDPCLQEALHMLFEKNIPVVKWEVTSSVASITICSSYLSEENKQLLPEIFKLGIASESYGYLVIQTTMGRNTTNREVSSFLTIFANAFAPQTLDYRKMKIEDVYNTTRRFLKSRHQPTPDNIPLSEKIAICQRLNQYLTLSDDGKYFYPHPYLKEKDNQITLKKEPNN